MRLKDLQRLNTTEAKLNNSEYLVYKPLFKELHSAITRFSGGRLLDIGCGNKPYRVWFDSHIDEYLGCDIIQSDLNKVDVICTAQSIPFPNASFDTVFTTQVIEHVGDHEGMLNEAFRLLKSGGKLILSGPFYWPLHEEPHDYFRYTKHGFKLLLEKAGFKVVEIKPCGGKWAVTGIMILSLIPFRPKVLNFILNPIFSRLDKIFFDPIITFNYVVVAEKP
jgi:SAM-dependent methyltransferase